MKATDRAMGAGRRAAIGAMAILAALSGGFQPVFAQSPSPSPADSWRYADIADLFLAAPIVARIRITEVIALKDDAAASRRLGTIRYYLSGDVVALIRGSGGLAPHVAWIADVPLDARGKPPKLKKAEMLVAAFAVPGKPGEIRLGARDAMVRWSPALDARVRAVIASSLAADAPPRITGIANAFHSAGNLPGEGETQVFLTTATAQPVSLQVLRRPGIEPRWAVAYGEIVDDAAAPPARDTLGWYRLACTLPPVLPPAAVAELAPADASAARVDYGFIIKSLGPCERVRS